MSAKQGAITRPAQSNSLHKTLAELKYKHIVAMEFEPTSDEVAAMGIPVNTDQHRA
jgi:hypothetical protein